MREITVNEATTALPDLVDAAIAGEEVVLITEDGQAVQLVPVAQSRNQPKFGSAKGQVWMSDDFDAPLDDFKEYM